MAIDLKQKATNITWEKSDTENFNSDASTKDGLEANFDYLNNKLQQVSRELSYWDMYKFAATLTDSNEFDKIFASLLPNTAMIINCGSPFTHNEKTFHIGDVVVKKEDGSYDHIKTQATGLYKPIAYSDNTLSFEYQSNNVESDTESVKIPIRTSSDPYYSEVINSFTTDNSSVYFTISKKRKNETSEYITPIVKWFKSINNKQEELIITTSITTDADSTKWKISIPLIKSTDLIAVVK